jgi:hypothetical protein
MSKTKNILWRSLVIIGALCILSIPFTVRGQEGNPVEGLSELKATVNIQVSWSEHDEFDSSLEKTGSMSASVTGTLILDKQQKGVFLFFPGSKGMNAEVKYQNETKDKKSGELYLEEEGSESVQVLSPRFVTDPQTQGHFEFIAFTGPGARIHVLQLSGQLVFDIDIIREIMTSKENMDHYTFSVATPIQTVMTDKDGNSEEGLRGIHFVLVAEALKGGAISNSVSWTAKKIKYSIGHQNFMGTVYGPPKSGDVNYTVSWTFGEVPPVVEIQREVNGRWIDITDKTVQVVAGEKMKLRGVVVPEDKDTGKGHWTVPGRTIKEFVVEKESGHACWLEEQDLEAQELAFHWWDGEDGLEVQYDTTSTDGKSLTGTAVFDVKEPDTVLRAYLSKGEFKVAEVKYKDVEGTELGLDTGNGQTISFCHDPLSAEFQPGATQFVQYVWTKGRMTRHKNVLAGPCIQIEVEGLDGYYPYAPGPETRDSPCVPVSIYDLTIAVENSFTMQLMYKPEIDGAIFVPLSELNWSWTGSCSRGSIGDDWDTKGSDVFAETTGTPAEAYLEWDHVSTGEETWDACE